MTVGRPGEEVGVVPVDEVRGGVVVGLWPGAGDKSPGTAVVFVRSRLQNGKSSFVSQSLEYCISISNSCIVWPKSACVGSSQLAQIITG